MKTAELLDLVLKAGVIVELFPPGKLKIAGDEQAVKRWIPELSAHKSELVKHLIESQDTAPPLTEAVTEPLQETPATPHGGLLPDDYEFSPAQCKGCAQCEVIMVDGQPPMAGCVRRLDTGPWAEVWHRLPADLQKCILH